MFKYEFVTPKVQLVAITPDADLLIARAIWISRHRTSPLDEPGEKLLELMQDVLPEIIKEGHHSVLEHAGATFLLDGVSRVLTHQLVRHRIASYTQQSLRYADPSSDSQEKGAVSGTISIVIPPAIAANAEAKRTFMEFAETSVKAYSALRAQTSWGVEREDARFVLPLAVATRIMLTANFRELRHIFALRGRHVGKHLPQWEILTVASRMCDLIKEAAPAFFADLAPAKDQAGSYVGIDRKEPYPSIKGLVKLGAARPK